MCPRREAYLELIALTPVLAIDRSATGVAPIRRRRPGRRPWLQIRRRASSELVNDSAAAARLLCDFQKKKNKKEFSFARERARRSGRFLRSLSG
jgi:hypothetical protein